MGSNRIPSLSETQMGQSPETIVEPPTIEGYRIKELLGHGGMGAVWHAVHLATDRHVALKVMHSKVFQSQTAQERFRVEVEVASQLEHAHIARVYEYRLDREPFYFTMELVKGEDLNTYVEKSNYTPRAILELMYRICQAVTYAHQNGVIHRDLKPSNILVTEGGVPYIIDFGVAKRDDDKQRALTMSGTGWGPGTLAYMAPEYITIISCF